MKPPPFPSLPPPRGRSSLSSLPRSLSLSFRPPHSTISEEMIKRQFYKQEHGDRSGSSSSDDSDSAPDADADEGHRVEAEEEEEETENKKKSLRYSSPGSGYESEDSSNYQSDNDASGLLTNDEGDNNNKDSKTVVKFSDNEVEKSQEMATITIDSNDPIQADFSNFILKYNSVFKCRLCPRILCINEATVRTHLTSKRHARSKKLLVEGRLKLMLNSNGELEEQEIHTERHARIVALSEKPDASKKDCGHQRQSRRRKKRMRRGSNKEKSKAATKNAEKKRRRIC